MWLGIDTGMHRHEGIIRRTHIDMQRIAVSIHGMPTPITARQGIMYGMYIVLIV